MTNPACRILELCLVHQVSRFADFDAAWMPRLVVMVRGSTSRMDEALDEDQRHRYRFGALGVSVGSPLGQSEVAGSRELVWRHAELAEIERLLQGLDALLSTQPIAAEGVVDTSDVFHNTHLSGRVDGTPFSVPLSQMASGYRGASAQAFAALLNELLPLAGLDLTDPRWSTLLDARA